MNVRASTLVHRSFQRRAIPAGEISAHLICALQKVEQRCFRSLRESHVVVGQNEPGCFRIVERAAGQIFSRAKPGGSGAL